MFTKKYNLQKRRQFLASLAGSAIALPLFGSGFTSQNQEPHFILTVYLSGGLDSSYLFDARPLAFTAARKIQNYHVNPQEPLAWQDAKGRQCLVQKAGQKLLPWKDKMTVLNGVIMDHTFDGHLENFRQLFCGANGGMPFYGGQTSKLQDPSLSYVRMGNFFGLGLLSDFAESMEANKDLLLSLNKLVKENNITENTEKDLVQEAFFNRIHSQFPGSGLSIGLKSAQKELLKKGKVAKHLRGIAIDESLPDSIALDVSILKSCFKSGLTQSAIYNLTDNLPGISFDTHDARSCSTSPDIMGQLMDKLLELLSELQNSPFDENHSLLDVTTVVVGSEFSRTMRNLGAPDVPMELQGTDHNALSNSLLFFGKGIKGGQVIGATDLDKLGSGNEFSHVTQIHKDMDRELIKSMSKGFSFETGLSMDIPITESELNLDRYLTMNSVINTVLDKFNVPQSDWRHLGGNANQPKARVITDLFL